MSDLVRDELPRTPPSSLGSDRAEGAADRANSGSARGEDAGRSSNGSEGSSGRRGAGRAPETAADEPPRAPGQPNAAISAVELKQLEDLSRDTTSKLHAVWDEMGLSEEERTRQLSSLVEAVENVFLQKVADEHALRDEYFNAAESLEREIDECSLQLGMERQYFQHGDSGNLMLRLTWLRSHLVQFHAVKEERMARLTEMSNKLVEIWDETGHAAETQFLSLEDFLTEEGIEEYHARLVQAQHERTLRIAELQEKMTDLVTLFEELEHEPTSELDRAIVEGGEALGISTDAVATLERRTIEMSTEKLRRTKQLEQLGNVIIPLWDKLGVGKEERDRFFMENCGLGLHIIEHCIQERDRMLALKDERMGDLIREAQDKIVALWDEMQFDDEQREVFTQSQMMGPVCEATLEAHEEEIAILSMQAGLYRPILKSIEKYFELCEERVEYEEKIKDSSRLLSRRSGTLLRDEEQQRQRVTKGIPRVIEKIKQSVAEYESEHGPFLLNGKRFVETLDANEAEHQEKLEEEKQLRVRAKASKEDVGRPLGKTPKKAAPAVPRPRPPLANRND